MLRHKCSAKIAVFFFNDTATTEIYTLSLHDALPIWEGKTRVGNGGNFLAYSHIGHDCTVGNNVVFSNNGTLAGHVQVDRKSTRLNSSHSSISYAVFCLKKKKKQTHIIQ